IQVAQKKVKKAFENADSSSRVELIPSKIKNAIKEVRENGETLPITKVMDGVITEMPFTTAEEKAQTRFERNKDHLDTMSIDDIYNNLKVYEAEVKGMSSSSLSTQNMDFVSSSNNNTSSTNGVVNTDHGVSTASTQVNAAYYTNIDNLSDVAIYDMEEIDLRWQMAMLTIRDRRALRNQDNKKKESSKRSVPVEGRYDWSDQAEEEPNYALMALASLCSDSEFLNRLVVKNCKAKFSKEEPKVVRKNDDAPIIEELVLDEEENVSQPKIKKKTVKPSIVKTKFVKSKQQGKTNRKTIKQLEQHSKAFRVFNSRTRIVKENLHFRFSENAPNAVGSGPNWLFDIDALTRTMNYEPIVAGTQSNSFADPKTSHDDGSKPLSYDGNKVDKDPRKENECNDQEKEDNVNNTNNVNIVSLTINIAGTNGANVVGDNISIELQFDPNMPALEDVSTFDSQVMMKMMVQNLFPPLDNPELTIRRRSRSDPTLLNNSEMAAEGNGDLPVPELQTMEELCQPSLNGRGGHIAPIAIKATNFGLKNDRIQQAWERYKLSVDRCPNHNMLPVTQIDTLYNGLTFRHRDTINAAGGTFMKRPLKAEMAKIKKNLMRVLQVNQQVKVVTPNYETYGGPHSFSNCPATIGNTQNVYAAGAYQFVTTNEFSNFMKANDALLKNMQTDMTSLTNLNLELKNMFGQFMKMNTASSSGSRTLPVVERETEATKNTVHPTNNESTEDVQPPVVLTESLILNSEPVISPIIEPVPSQVSAPRPNQRPSIPYPSRLYDQKLHDKANDQ
nr:reverse transcriptase domain-containing protein [Tanacetum cinerariifolium]